MYIFKNKTAEADFEIESRQKRVTKEWREVAWSDAVVGRSAWQRYKS